MSHIGRSAGGVAAAILIALLPVGSIAATPSTRSIERAIRAVEARQEAAWNAHDSTAYAALFAEDADVVNVLGWHWKSRAELRDKLGRAFATVFRATTLHIESVTFKPIAPGVVVAHVGWTMTGALSPDGSGGNIPQQGLQTQVLRRTPGGWTIVAFQNTNAVPERAFGPQSVPA